MGAENASNKKRVKLNNYFENIKSKYILIKIFDNLPKKKMLKIIKENKAIQNKLEISLNDYMKYSEIFNPIEIEIIPIADIFAKFIKRPKEEEKSYFHLYFNDEKEEIFDFPRSITDDIKKITVKIIIMYNH